MLTDKILELMGSASLMESVSDLHCKQVLWENCFDITSDILRNLLQSFPESAQLPDESSLGEFRKTY